MPTNDFPDAESVVAWFMTDKDGNRNDPPTHDEADLRGLVHVMLEKPDPFSIEKTDTLAPVDAWKLILEFGLLYLGGRQGWIERDGKFWTCGHAKHDLLLYWMNMEPREAEARGWVRVTQWGRYRSRYRMSPKQRRVLKSLGITPQSDTERMLPFWTDGDDRPMATANLGVDRNG